MRSTTGRTFAASIRSHRSERCSVVTFATKKVVVWLRSRDFSIVPAMCGSGPSPRYDILPPTTTNLASGVSTRLHARNERLPAMSTMRPWADSESCEVVRRVVDDAVRAEGPRLVDVSRAADGGHV